MDNTLLHKRSKYKEKRPEGTEYIFAAKWDSVLKTHNIHGLWPENSIVNPLIIEWDQHKLLNFKIQIFGLQTTSLLEILKETWVSELHYSNQDFWKHEWEKHGRCMPLEYEKLNSKYLKVLEPASTNQISDYFLQTIGLYEFFLKVNLLDESKHTQIYHYLDKNFKLLDSEQIFIN